MTMPPPPPVASAVSGNRCTFCGAEGTLVARAKELTAKKRPKFGVMWVLFAILTGGIGFLCWLVWPRHKEVVSVDRFTECTACKAKI